VNEPELEPLPLEAVLSIVDRRARRQKALLRGGLGLGAVAVVVAGIHAVDDGSSSRRQPVADEPPASSTTSSTPLRPGQPQWQLDAANRAYDEGGFEFSDAEVLANLWGVETYTTKVVVGEAIRTDTPADIEALVANPGDIDAATAVDDALRTAFWDNYTPEDAAELAARWGVDEYDAKLMAAARSLQGESVDDP
jgi:hypothetical protein